MPKHINLDYLLEICDHDTLRMKLITETFLVSIKVDLNNMEENLPSMSNREIKDLAHKIKSQMKYFEANEASHLLESIEISEDSEDIKQKMEECLTELKAVVKEVEIANNSM